MITTYENIIDICKQAGFNLVIVKSLLTTKYSGKPVKLSKVATAKEMTSLFRDAGIELGLYGENLKSWVNSGAPEKMELIKPSGAPVKRSNRLTPVAVTGATATTLKQTITVLSFMGLTDVDAYSWKNKTCIHATYDGEVSVFATGKNIRDTLRQFSDAYQEVIVNKALTS
jgi:hypothetical protein